MFKVRLVFPDGEVKIVDAKSLYFDFQVNILHIVDIDDEEICIVVKKDELNPLINFAFYRLSYTISCEGVAKL